MGEVYRVRGTKLDLDVALKVLPQAFTDDPDRLTRFECEAKVLASLNHPNIGGIHGLEESEGTKVPVLELDRRAAENAGRPFYAASGRQATMSHRMASVSSMVPRD